MSISRPVGEVASPSLRLQPTSDLPTLLTPADFLAAPFQLQEGEVGIIDSEVCKMYFQSPDSSSSEYSIHEDMFCAGDLMTGKSICRVSEIGSVYQVGTPLSLCVFSGSCP